MKLEPEESADMITISFWQSGIMWLVTGVMNCRVVVEWLTLMIHIRRSLVRSLGTITRLN